MRKNIFCLILLVLLSSFLPVYSCDCDMKPDIPTITVSGYGEVDATPDVAILNISIESEGRTAQEATTKNADLAESLVNTLKTFQVLKKDVQTGHVSVYPFYKPMKVYDPSEKNIAGYKASNNVTIKIREISNAGKIIDKATSIGNLRVNGVNFDIEDKQTYEEEALKIAVQKAKRKAEIVVTTAGSAIVGIKKINLDYSQPVYPMYKNMRMEAVAYADSAGMAPPETPVEPGAMKITQNVSIEFEVRK